MLRIVLDGKNLRMSCNLLLRMELTSSNYKFQSLNLSIAVS